MDTLTEEKGLMTPHCSADYFREIYCIFFHYALLGRKSTILAIEEEDHI